MKTDTTKTITLPDQHALAQNLKKHIEDIGGSEFDLDPWQIECLWMQGVQAALALDGKVLPPAWQICQQCGRSILTLTLSEAEKV